MADVRKTFVLDQLADKAYRKCGLCHRVRSLFYRLTVKDTQTGSTVIATLSLCSTCGAVFGDIIGKPVHSRQTQRRIQL